jgi:hypothetical protein
LELFIAEMARWQDGARLASSWDARDADNNNRCDAEPDVLSDYIIALLKNDSGLPEPELEEVSLFKLCRALLLIIAVHGD